MLDSAVRAARNHLSGLPPFSLADCGVVLQYWLVGERMESGACECDVPQTAHEVRKLRVCSHCGMLGKELHERRLNGGVERLHTKCAVAKYGLEECVRLGLAQGGQKMRLCCLGDDGMTKLLDLLEARHGA